MRTLSKPHAFILLLILNEICNVLLCAVKTNRPFHRVSLEIHLFHLSQVGPEIRGKDVTHEYNGTISLGFILNCFDTYRFAWITRWPRRSRTSFFTLEIPYHQVKRGTLLLSWSMTELVFGCLTTWPAFPGNPVIPWDPVEPWHEKIEGWSLDAI